MEDTSKPFSFEVSLEDFLTEMIRIRRRDSKALVEKFATIGIIDPTGLVKAWKLRKFDNIWLSVEGDFDDEEIDDFVKNFRKVSEAYDLNSEFQKLLGGLGWMREGEQEVRSWLGDTASDEIQRLVQFDLHFARNVLRPSPLWYQHASEPLKKALNERGFSFAKLLYEVVLSKDRMQQVQLGALAFVGHLGQGSFGVCTHVRDKAKGLDMAMKTQMVMDQESLAAFQQEVTLLTRIDSPFVVAIIAGFFGVVRGMLGYFMMEYCPGGTLRDAMRCFANGSLLSHSRLTFWKYVCGIFAGVKCLHEFEPQIIHRDLKPENILIGSDGQVKVADFGLFKATGPGGGSSLRRQGSSSRRVKGTTEYLPPEVYDYDEDAAVGAIDYSTAGDVWAIGVMITRMACGLLFASYIDEVTGKQRRSCAEYVAAVMSKAAELGATEERLRLSLLRQLLSGCLQESKFDRKTAGECLQLVSAAEEHSVGPLMEQAKRYKLVPLVHMTEMEALLPRFDQLDSAINSGPEHWDDLQVEEAQLLLEKTNELLQRILVYAASPEMAQGLQLLETAVVDENTRYGVVTTAIVEKLVLEMNPAQHQAFEAFVAEVAQALAHPSLDRPQQAQQQAGVSSLGELYNQAAALKPAFAQMVNLVVGSAGGTARVAPLKGLVRVCEKAVLEYQRLLQRLVDILRAQIICEDLAEVEAVVRAVVALDFALAALLGLSAAGGMSSVLLGWSIEILAIKSRLGMLGDVVIRIKVVVASVSHVCELQVALRKALVGRDDLGQHLSYNWSRFLGAVIKTLKSRDLTTIGQATVDVIFIAPEAGPEKRPLTRTMPPGLSQYPGLGQYPSIQTRIANTVSRTPSAAGSSHPVTDAAAVIEALDIVDRITLATLFRTVAARGGILVHPHGDKVPLPGHSAGDHLYDRILVLKGSAEELKALARNRFTLPQDRVVALLPQSGGSQHMRSMSGSAAASPAAGGGDGADGRIFGDASAAPGNYLAVLHCPREGGLLVHVQGIVHLLVDFTALAEDLRSFCEVHRLSHEELQELGSAASSVRALVTVDLAYVRDLEDLIEFICEVLIAPPGCICSNITFEQLLEHAYRNSTEVVEIALYTQQVFSIICQQIGADERSLKLKKGINFEDFSGAVKGLLGIEGGVAMVFRLDGSSSVVSSNESLAALKSGERLAVSFSKSIILLVPQAGPEERPLTLQMTDTLRDVRGLVNLSLALQDSASLVLENEATGVVIDSDREFSELKHGSRIMATFCESRGACVAGWRPDAFVDVFSCRHKVCRPCVASKVVAARVDRPRLGTEWDEDPSGQVHAESSAQPAVGSSFGPEFGVNRAGGPPPRQPKSRLSLFRFPALLKPPLPSGVDPYDFWPTINDIACPVAGCTQFVGQQDIENWMEDCATDYENSTTELQNHVRFMKLCILADETRCCKNGPEPLDRFIQLGCAPHNHLVHRDCISGWLSSEISGLVKRPRNLTCPKCDVERIRCYCHPCDSARLDRPESGAHIMDQHEMHALVGNGLLTQVAINCLYSTCETDKGGCGQEFCFVCSAPLTPTMIHGNHFHRPQCDFTSRHSCEEIRRNLAPDHADCADSNQAFCCDAKCIANGLQNCAQDKYSPGPCDACNDTPEHNTCTHSEWRPCKRCIPTRQTCAHWCTECERKGSLCTVPGNPVDPTKLSGLKYTVYKHAEVAAHAKMESGGKAFFDWPLVAPVSMPRTGAKRTPRDD